MRDRRFVRGGKKRRREELRKFVEGTAREREALLVWIS
jgi:hypothetical protein